MIAALQSLSHGNAVTAPFAQGSLLVLYCYATLCTREALAGAIQQGTLSRSRAYVLSRCLHLAPLITVVFRYAKNKTYGYF